MFYYGFRYSTEILSTTYFVSISDFGIRISDQDYDDGHLVCFISNGQYRSVCLASTWIVWSFYLVLIYSTKQIPHVLLLLYRN